MLGDKRVEQNKTTTKTNQATYQIHTLLLLLGCTSFHVLAFCWQRLPTSNSNFPRQDNRILITTGAFLIWMEVRGRTIPFAVLCWVCIGGASSLTTINMYEFSEYIFQFYLMISFFPISPFSSLIFSIDNFCLLIFHTHINSFDTTSSSLHPSHFWQYPFLLTNLVSIFITFLSHRI